MVYLPFMIEAWPRRCSSSRYQQCCSNSERGVQHSGRCCNCQSVEQPPKVPPLHPPKYFYFRSVSSCFNFLGESLSRPQTPYAATPTGGSRRMAAPKLQDALPAGWAKDRARGPAIRPWPQAPKRRATATILIFTHMPSQPPRAVLPLYGATCRAPKPPIVLNLCAYTGP